MSHFRMRKILAVVCAVILLAVAGIKLISSAFAEQYNVGGAEIGAPVRELKINWTSGAVNIAYHSGNTILISEKTSGMISEDMRMRWRLEGDSLIIEYEKPGFHFFSFFSHEKILTVTLPQGLTLEKATIVSTSGDLNIPALYADSLKLETTSGDVHAAVNARTIKGKATSGDMELAVMNEAEEIKLQSTSGDITLESAWAAGQAEISSTSGDIRAAIKQVGEFKISSTSGGIHAVTGSVKKAEIKSTSGKVITEMAEMDELNIRTTSGEVTAYFPEALGFSAHIETVSGRFEHSFPMTQQGKTYVSGDGSRKVEIHTTSGDITISVKEDR